MFSLENTVAPPAPALDELVPSRYALKVGDIDVLVVSDGVLPLPTQMLGHNVSQAERAAWFKDMYLPPDALDWALNVMVVRSGDQAILIDAGLGTDPDLQLPRAGQLIRRLGASGIDLTEITDVVITHMHMDHIGGLLVEGVKEQLRPDLRVHVAASEVEFWKSPDFTRTNMPPGFPDALRATAKHFWAEYSSYIRTFEDEHEVAPGVTVRRTGGHTPGHSVVRVNSQGSALTFAGDAIFAVGFEQPTWHNGFEHDPEASAQVRIELLQELAGTGEMLVATHLPFPSVGRVSVDGDVFRWVPVFWDF
ncbi:MBL fold metallo-hydrolase [Stenotrophomonas sp. AB1(2024)]|uniref:MBL fold metallo-hydrolase n=1 Tax=Stenotrophomonas sp. AB1(2024) TaxID=3132215 RepID=UPI0030A10DB4